MARGVRRIALRLLSVCAEPDARQYGSYPGVADTARRLPDAAAHRWQFWRTRLRRGARDPDRRAVSAIRRDSRQRDAVWRDRPGACSARDGVRRAPAPVLDRGADRRRLRWGGAYRLALPLLHVRLPNFFGRDFFALAFRNCPRKPLHPNYGQPAWPRSALLSARASVSRRDGRDRRLPRPPAPRDRGALRARAQERPRRQIPHPSADCDLRARDGTATRAGRTDRSGTSGLRAR